MQPAPEPSATVTIALDAMGGDHAPEQAVRGALEYRRAGGRARLLLVGRQDAVAAELREDVADVEIVHAADVVAMDEHPASALRRRAATSIGIATELVREERAAAVVSAGNTGATMASAVLTLRPLPNIHRPALCTLMPTGSGRKTCVLDIGATVDTDARDLFQFAVMGSLFMEKVHGVERPTVALLNIGEEAGKGSRVLQEAEALLRRSELNFVGNVEGRDVPEGSVNVVVCDGLVGNVMIKAMEGVVDVMRQKVRGELLGGALGLLARPLVARGAARLRRSFDYEVTGGAPLLGVDGVSIATHGRARPRMIRYAIEVAERAVSSGLIEAIRGGLETEATAS